MPSNIVYELTGSGVSVAFGPSSLQLTLDQSYAPFDGESQVPAGDLSEEAGDQGVRVTGALHGQIAGRGGPIEKTLHFTLFLPDSASPPGPGEEKEATGAIVFADPDARGDVSPEFGAEALTGVVKGAGGGRF